MATGAIAIRPAKEPFGYRWSIAHRLEQLSDEEIRRRASAAFDA